jgi:hypothetical protein
MSSLLALSQICYFLAFDSSTKELLYSKYNFNFTQYAIDFSLQTTNKLIIFKDFLKRNNTSYSKPYTVEPSLVKYFTPMTEEIVNYVLKYAFSIHNFYINIKDPLTYINESILLAQQFDLVYYTDDQIRRTQDFNYAPNGTIQYSKYNFNFDLYSSDYNVFGNKLVIFTDFVIRCGNLSGVTETGTGYGSPSPTFDKYFLEDPVLIDYMIPYSVTSVYDNVGKSINNIDFIAYGKDNPDLSPYADNVVYLKEHYLRYGQFEKRIITFKQSPMSNFDYVNGAVATVWSPGQQGSNFKLGSGFLYDNEDGNVYLITCYHNVKGQSNLSTIKANFEDIVSIEPMTNTIQFTVIGYDVYADILVAIYDPTLQFNIINNVNINNYNKLKIDFTYKAKLGLNVYTIAQLSTYDNNCLLDGVVINPLYEGTFNDTFFLGSAPTLLIQLKGINGISGSPIMVLSDRSLLCIGMMIGYIDTEKNYIIGIAEFNFGQIVKYIINNWFIANTLYDNINTINFFIKNGFTKCWLGIKCSYYHPILSPIKSKSLSNFTYNGGILVEDFILGYNTLSKTFITDSVQLGKPNVIQINTPLLTSKLYNIFIRNNKTPLIFKSVTFFNGLDSILNKLYLGKFSTQKGYSNITYGLRPIGNKQNDSFFLNPYNNQYPLLIFEYYYFNSVNWVLDTETIGGNTLDWYNTYTDSTGIYKQHKFEFPFNIVSDLNCFNGNNVFDYDDDGVRSAPIQTIQPPQAITPLPISYSQIYNSAPSNIYSPPNYIVS